MRTRKARLAEAYEELWEECSLEAYLHRHPSATVAAVKREEEGDDHHDEEEVIQENATEVDSEDDATDSERETLDSNDEEDTSDGLGDDKMIDEIFAPWTQVELAIFFPSLARRSRFFPDLISQDLDHSKSTSQVALLLTLLKEQSNKQEQDSIFQSPDNQLLTTTSSSRAIRKSRRLARMPGAFEVSKEWLEFEESQAAALRGWDRLDEAEELVGRASPPVQVDDEEGAGREENVDAEAGAHRDNYVVSWDEQVTNALLFLRHCPSICPESNDSNFYAAPATAQSTKLFSFPALSAIRLLTSKTVNSDAVFGQDKDHSYSTFAALHPSPDTHSGTDERREELAWRILYRGIELGILTWVELVQKGDGLPEGRLSKKARPSVFSRQRGGSNFIINEQGRLLWLDTVIASDGRKEADDQLRTARRSATRRLMNELQWEELNYVNCSSLEKNAGAETSTSPRQKDTSSSDENHFKGFDLSTYSDPLEKKRIKMRIIRRIERYGEEVALKMPLEVQKKGRKRKVEDSDVGTSEKRIRLNDGKGKAGSVVDGDEADNEDENDREEEEQASNDVQEMPSNTNNMPKRFELIGISGQTSSSLLSKEVQESLKLFNTNILRKVAQHHREPDTWTIEGLSHNSLIEMHSLLRRYLEEVISSTIYITASNVNVKGDSREVIGVEQVRMAVLQAQPKYANPWPRKWQEAPEDDHFRSDPPRLYPIESSHLQDLKVQMQGLHSLQTTAAATSHIHQYTNITNNTVVSASDAFAIPISSAYIRQRSPTAVERDVLGENILLNDCNNSEEESSVYDDSDQEREVQMRRDERKGVRREDGKVDGRVWEYNHRRQKMELERWQRLEEADTNLAIKHEKELWASVGLEPKQERQLLRTSEEWEMVSDEEEEGELQESIEQGESDQEEDTGSEEGHHQNSDDNDDEDEDINV